VGAKKHPSHLPTKPKLINIIKEYLPIYKNLNFATKKEGNKRQSFDVKCQKPQ